MGATVFLLSMLLLFGVLLPTKKITAQAKVHGVIAGQNKKPLPAVNVLLLRTADSSLVKGAVTNNNGAFEFTAIPVGNYIVVASFSGYKNKYLPLVILHGSNEVDAGEIALLQIEAELEKVTVVTRKPFIEQQIDRTIVNVKNSITSAGSTALDVLERSPGVIVDRQNNGISMNGKDGVIIMINGKINRLPIEAVVQMLAGMSSANLERVELITTPPANYDAEGNAGFINIVMVENTDFGTNGAYSVSAGIGWGNIVQGSINLNHRKDRINLYGDLSVFRQHQKQLFKLSRTISNNGKLVETDLASNRDPTQLNQNARVGIDYQLTKKTIVGVLGSFYENRWSMDAITDQTIEVINRLDTVVTINNEEVNKWKHRGVNLNLSHSFTETEVINFDADYLRYHNNNPNDYDNNYEDGNGNTLFNIQTRSRKTTPITVYVQSLNYKKKLGKKVSLQLGAKSSFSSFTNNISLETFVNNVWSMDPDFSANYELKEDIIAGFGAMDVEVNDKTSLKFGLRYEYTTSNLGTQKEKNIVDRKYGNLFPTIFISRKIDPNNALNFAYSRRITRPTFNQLAPFLYFFDPNSFIQGNAALQPAISNTVKVDYTYKRYIFSLSYSYDHNAIVRAQPTTDSISNKQIFSGSNVKSLQSITTNISLPITIGKGWNMQYNIIGTWQKVKTSYNNVPLTLQLANYRITTTQTFRLKNDFSAELFAFLQSPAFSGYVRNRAFGTLNIGLQKKLGKGNLKLNGTNLFNTNYARFFTDIPSQNLVTNATLIFGKRTFTLAYTRSFGNQKLKAKRNNTGAEEERRRVE